MEDEIVLLHPAAFVMDVTVIVVEPEFDNAVVLKEPLPELLRLIDTVFPVALFGADRL